MDIYEVVTRLVGPIKPVGETHADEIRYENTIELLRLMTKLHGLIDEVATDNKDRQEYSMKRIGEACNQYLDNLGIPN